ncbi:MAG: antibiotic biosynthesis monooxygenase [Bacteroidia bacterium]|nr:antibiotic biosynthesis monooxygenase [Bacteroidia bacterium]
MIWRWVEMFIQPECFQTARQLLLRQADRVRSFSGCFSLWLYEGDSFTLYSLSLWESVEALEAYRNSRVFRDFWAQIRLCFRKRARAITLTRFPIER